MIPHNFYLQLIFVKSHLVNNYIFIYKKHLELEFIEHFLHNFLINKFLLKHLINWPGLIVQILPSLEIDIEQNILLQSCCKKQNQILHDLLLVNLDDIILTMLPHNFLFQFTFLKKHLVNSNYVHLNFSLTKMDLELGFIVHFLQIILINISQTKSSLIWPRFFNSFQCHTLSFFEHTGTYMYQAPLWLGALLEKLFGFRAFTKMHFPAWFQVFGQTFF